MSNDTSFELRFLHKSKKYLERVRRYAEEKKARWDEFQATRNDVKELMTRLGTTYQNEVGSWGFDFEEITREGDKYCLPALTWANQNVSNVPMTGENGELADILAHFPELTIEGTFTDEYGQGSVSQTEQEYEIYNETDEDGYEGCIDENYEDSDEDEIDVDDEDEDEVDYESSLKLNPDWTNNAWAIRAETHATLGEINYKTALELYDQAVESAEQEDYGKAIELYNRSIEADPDYPWSYNNLAWLHATCMNPSCHNGAEAVRRAQKACELVGYNFWSMLDTLAAAYARAGQFDEAVKWGEKALELAPDDAKSDEWKMLDFYRKSLPYTCIICINSDGTVYNNKSKIEPVFRLPSLGCFICKRRDVNVFPVDDAGKFAVCAECHEREVVAKRQCFNCGAKLGWKLISMTENSTQVIARGGKVMVVERCRFACEECEQSGEFD